MIAHFFAKDAPATAAAKIAVTAFGNFAMLHAWAPVLSGPWNTPGWSLSAEAFFYLAFPLLAPPLWRLGLGRLTAVVLAVHAASLALPALA